MLKRIIIAISLAIPLTASTPFKPIPVALESIDDLPSSKVAEIDLNEVRCLADNIYHEARGEPENGRIAVALVTMKRVFTKGFPDTVCGVVKDRIGKVYQFSWVGRNLTADRDSEDYEYARFLAEQVYLNYKKMVDFTKGSLFYHATSVNPDWKLQQTVRIGHHIFYKPKETDVQQRSSYARGGS